MFDSILRNLDFSKEVIMYAYGAEKSIGTILTKKVENHEKHPITFFSQTLHDAKERYGFIEKWVSTIMKSLNKFKHYIP